jgi:hypothetical protein
MKGGQAAQGDGCVVGVGGKPQRIVYAHCTFAIGVAIPKHATRTSWMHASQLPILGMIGGREYIPKLGSVNRSEGSRREEGGLLGPLCRAEAKGQGACPLHLCMALPRGWECLGEKAAQATRRCFL